MKRIISLLLALGLILGMVPFSAMALEPAVQLETYTHINPLYADVVTEADLKTARAPAAAPHAAGDPVYATTFAEAGAQMRQAMVNREETVVAYYQSTDFDSSVHEDIFWEAVAHTGNPDEGDALRWVYAGYNVSISRSVRNGISYASFTYTMTYYTNAAQEAELEKAMDALLATVDPKDSKYGQFCTVYDYICENITYDYDTLYDGDYKLKYTAYAALVNKTAVCQGYAVLLYQLALELGIDCRVITGTGNGGAHGWNIVKFGNVYYNTDATWDATWYQALGYYNYFLQNEDTFTDHFRNAEYDTAAFHALYPMSSTNFDPNAQPEVFGGACGANLNWELCDGVLTISGTGEIYDYGEAPWAEYRDQIKTIVVKKGVTAVGKNAFDNCKNLTSVSLPNGLERIGVAAFAYCENLENISIPGSVDTIGKSAFCECLKLKEIVIPEGVTEISYEAFRNCQSLASVTIPSTVKIIGDTAFLHCHSLKEVMIPDGVTTIEYGAFWRCYGLESVTIPDSVTYIGSYAFSECENLKSVTIPRNITVIRQHTFNDCCDLAEVNLPDGLTEIEKYAFYGCDALEQIDLPRSLTTIGEYALAYSKVMKSVTIPAAVEKIGSYAFAGDTLESVYFQGDAPVIGEYGFGYQNMAAYYPAGNPTWTEDVMLDYGGAITWLPLESGHYYEAVVTEPTCTEEGYTTYTCTECGDVYIASRVPALGHNYKSVKVNATCTEDGSVTHTCTVCGDSYVEVIAALGHYIQSFVTKPTCTEEGYTTYFCNRCEYVYTDDVVPALGHDWNNGVVIKEPSETEPGTKYFVCLRCALTKTESIPPLGHEHSYTAVVTGPTCTKQGCTTYICECGDQYVGNVVPATGHSWDDGVVTKAPTEKETGLKIYTCNTCGATDEAVLPKLNHTHDYQAVVTKPTCTAAGYTTYICECGDSYVSDPVEALGHAYKNGTCAVCGHVSVAAPVAKGSNDAATGKPKVTWAAVEGAVKYEVYRSTSKNGTYTRGTGTTKTTYTNTKAVAGKYYYYFVRAIAADGSYADSGIIGRTCDLAQTTVTVSNVASSGKVKISWEAVEGATKYEVYRATSKTGTYSRISTTANTSVTNTKAEAGKTYYYKVRAICDVDAAAAAYSAVKSRTCDLPRPTVSIALSSGKPKVSWGKVEGAVSYKVYRAASKTGTYSLVKTTTSLSYKNTGAAAGKTYYYKVVAVCSNTAGNSAYSGIVSIKSK